MLQRVAAIILNFNNRSLTLRSARSILSSPLPDNSLLIIVDNGPRDNRTYFGRHLQPALYLHPPSNRGFAAGNNLGITYALEHGATHILIQNPDVILPKNAVNTLLSTLRKHPSAGLVAPALRTPGSKLYSLGGYINRTFARFNHDNTLTLPSTPIKYDFVSFACVLIQAKTLRDLGLLDEGYFMYLEDVDYCVRATNAGYRVLCDPRVVATHQVSSSFTDPRDKIFLSLRSCYYYINKHYYPQGRLLPLLSATFFYSYTYLLWTLKYYRHSQRHK